MKRTAIIIFTSSITHLSITSSPWRAQPLSLPSKINIFCTNNFDGTGQCFEVKTNTLLKCTGVPGEIIPCRIPGGASYNCIFFSEALLACNRVLAKSIEERADNIQNRSPFENDFDDVLSEPLVNPTDNSTGSSSGPVEKLMPNPKNKGSDGSSKPIIIPAW